MRDFRIAGSGPLLFLLTVSLAVLTNPLDVVWTLIRHAPLLADLVREPYFLAGPTLCASGLAARGIDAFLQRPSRDHRLWFSAVFLTAVLAWAGFQIYLWLPQGPSVQAGRALW